MNTASAYHSLVEETINSMNMQTRTTYEFANHNSGIYTQQHQHITAWWKKLLTSRTCKLEQLTNMQIQTHEYTQQQHQHITAWWKKLLTSSIC